jgi:DUF1680 family protein
MPTTQKDVQAAFQSLYDGLTQAYWSASTIEAKDRIYGVEEIVFDILTDLEKNDLESDYDAFKTVKANVAPVLKKLDALKKEIDDVIQAVKVATEVAGYLDQAIKLAAKYFAL